MTDTNWRVAARVRRNAASKWRYEAYALPPGIGPGGTIRAGSFPIASYISESHASEILADRADLDRALDELDCISEVLRSAEANRHEHCRAVDTWADRALAAERAGLKLAAAVETWRHCPPGTGDGVLLAALRTYREGLAAAAEETGDDRR